MSQNYVKKKPTGREYVDSTKEFCNTTHLRCNALPKRWSETLLFPLIRCADDIETKVCVANKVYISNKNLSTEELIEAYKKRIGLLEDAVALFSDFDIKFDRLMGMIDIAGSEKNRLKGLIYNILEEEKKTNPELENIEIKVISHADEMEYRSLSGTQCYKLKLTRKNKDHWLDTELTALNNIRNRISSDKKAVFSLQKTVCRAVG